MLTAVGAHPVTERAFVDTELLRHSGDRARRLDHHLHGFLLEFRREALLRPGQLLHLSRHPSYWMDCPEASGHPSVNDVGYQMVARPLLERLDAVRGEVHLTVLRPPTFDALAETVRQA